MNWRATWVCAVTFATGCIGWAAIAQDDLEVPGLGFGPRGGGPRGGGAPFNALILDDGLFPQPVQVPAPPPEEELPDDAKAIIDGLDKEAAEIRRKAEQEVAARREKAIKALKVLQDKYTRDAKLDEAVAIRNKIRRLGVAHLKVTKNPGNLAAYVNKVDHSFFFEVVGANGGSVWGTEVYTCDSYLAAAAVHAGVLKVGQRGIVKVTILRSPDEHVGSAANGIRSNSWGPYPASYTVEAPEPRDVTTPEPAADK